MSGKEYGPKKRNKAVLPCCPQHSLQCLAGGCFMPWDISVAWGHTLTDPKSFQLPALLLSPVCSSGTVWSTRDGANHLLSPQCLET